MPRPSKPLVLVLCMFASLAVSAAEPQSWLVESMYSSGKINTVVAVVAVLVAGLATWMFLMDRKLQRLEKEVRDGHR